MFNLQSLIKFREKVPALKKSGLIIITVLYIAVLASLCAGVFFLANRQFGDAGKIGSQFLISFFVTAFGFIHFRKAARYRSKYNDLAYQHYFYRLILPYVVMWYAVCFHPLGAGGNPLLPSWLAIVLGVILLVIMGLVSIQIERAGFSLMTHGMDIYSVFPEETSAVHGDIYGYIRHPLYFCLLTGSLALGLFRNTALALILFLFQLLPAVMVGLMEDRELIKRYGDSHREYIKKTVMFLPIRHSAGFLKTLFRF